MDTRNKVFVVVGTVAVLATAGIVGMTLFTQKDTASTNGATSQATNSSSSNTSNSSSTASSTSTYKDGTYTSTQTYSVPHGETNTLKATVVISSGKISSVQTDDTYTDRESGQYVSRFESAVSSSATGQSIGSYSPSRIGGASLTTSAFSEALSDIATQAKA